MATLKQLKRMLKKAGVKSSGSKRALTRRAKKAHLMQGGNKEAAAAAAAAKIRAEEEKFAPLAAAREAGREAALRIEEAAEIEGRRNRLAMAGIAPPRNEAQREAYLASVPYGSRPGGLRKSKKTASKKTVTHKKRPLRHLTASAYRW